MTDLDKAAQMILAWLETGDAARGNASRGPVYRAIRLLAEHSLKGETT